MESISTADLLIVSIVSFLLPNGQQEIFSGKRLYSVEGAGTYTFHYSISKLLWIVTSDTK